MAVYDPVRVCNMALNRIGITQKVVSLGDVTDHLAVTCNDWYDICRDRVLSAFGWPFAMIRAPLGLVKVFTLSTDPNIEWAYSYRYPITCLIARRIVSGIRPDADAVPFEVGQDATGRLIFTNQPNAIIEMTATYADPGEWPDVLADAVSAALAIELAGPLRVASDKKGTAKADYANALLRAQGAANQERKIGPRAESKYISSRGFAPRNADSQRWR